MPNISLIDNVIKGIPSIPNNAVYIFRYPMNHGIEDELYIHSKVIYRKRNWDGLFRVCSFVSLL